MIGENNITPGHTLTNTRHTRKPKLVYIKSCSQCGDEFVCYRKHAQTCSNTCRKNLSNSSGHTWYESKIIKEMEIDQERGLIPRQLSALEQWRKENIK